MTHPTLTARQRKDVAYELRCTRRFLRKYRHAMQASRDEIDRTCARLMMQHYTGVLAGMRSMLETLTD